MIAQLTRSERQSALIILIALAVVGLVMAATGGSDPFGIHGALVMVLALLGTFAVIAGYYAPEPPAERLGEYYDEPSRIGILLAMAWAVFALFVGDWVVWQLVNPDLTFGAAWSSFGRIRPVHTTGIIFGFGGNAPANLDAAKAIKLPPLAAKRMAGLFDQASAQ